MAERAREDQRWQRALRSTEPCSGRLKRGLAAAVLAVSLLATWLAFAGSDARLRYPDAFDYAQMGRQLASGEGMTSLQAFPYVLGWLEAGGYDTAPPWPIVWRFPLPVVARAAAFRLFGASDGAALLPALLFSALTAPLLFLLANRLGGPLAGLLASLLWIASPSQQQLAETGLTEPGAALLAVALVGLALRARDEAGWRASALLGATLGLAFLQRTNLLALAPGAIAIALTRTPQRRASKLAAVGAAALLVASPWLVRNLFAFGEPLLNLTSDRGLLRLGLGHDPFFQLAVPDRAAVLRSSLALYPSGWTWDWLRSSAPAMLGREFAWLLPLAGLASAIGVGRSTWALAWSGLALTALVFAPPYPDVLRFYWPYTPLFLAGCSAAIVRWASRIPLANENSGAIAAASVLAGFVLFAPQGATAPIFPPRAAPLELGWLADRLEPGALLASDASFAVAWQAPRPSVRFVGNLRVMAAIDERIARIDGLHTLAPNARFSETLQRPPLSELFAPASAQTGTLFVRR